MYKPQPTAQPYREIMKSVYENFFNPLNKQFMSTIIIIAT